MPVEIQHPGVYVEELPGDAHPIAGVATSVAAFVGAALQGPVASPVAVRSFADFERTFGGLSADLALGYAVMQFFANGGRDAVVVRAAPSALDGALATLAEAEFNLLCIPPPADGIDLDVATRAAAAALCRRRGALFVVDPSQAWQRAGDAVAGLDAYFPNRGAESALYFPFVQAADPLAKGKVRAFAPCGAVAGLMARTDTSRGVWKAPAGTDAVLQDIVAPALLLNDGDNATLNPLGINALRTFPGRAAGTVVWGARTLIRPSDGDGTYRYVPVRRFATFLEHSVSKGTQWAVFEPNTEQTWARLRRDVGNFLYGLFRQGVFAGATPREGYFVKCDADTTTAGDIAAGRLNIVLGFALLRPAEFAILKISLVAATGDP